MEPGEGNKRAGRQPTVGTPVYWDRLPTPLGPVYVAAGPAGVVAIGTAEPSARAFADRLAEALGAEAPLVAGPSPLLTQALRELDSYFAGELTAFTVPCDLRLVQAAFHRRVLEALRTVPWGHLVSYGELARRVQAPRAARAAGAACGANPLPILIPCHRVVRADGSIGGYGSTGVAYKRALLAIEQVIFPATG